MPFVPKNPQVKKVSRKPAARVADVECAVGRARKAVREYPFPQTAFERADRFKAHYEITKTTKLSPAQYAEVLSLELLAQGIADGVLTIVASTRSASSTGLGDYSRQQLLESVVRVLESRI